MNRNLGALKHAQHSDVRDASRKSAAQRKTKPCLFRPGNRALNPSPSTAPPVAHSRPPNSPGCYTEVVADPAEQPPPSYIDVETRNRVHVFIRIPDRLPV